MGSKNTVVDYEKLSGTLIQLFEEIPKQDLVNRCMLRNCARYAKAIIAPTTEESKAHRLMTTLETMLEKGEYGLLHLNNPL